MAKRKRLLEAPRQIEAQPVERMTPRRFLDVYTNARDSIESVHIVPPRVGSRSFGHIIVRRKLYWEK